MDITIPRPEQMAVLQGPLILQAHHPLLSRFFGQDRSVLIMSTR